jgi:adenylate kinase
VDKRAYNMLTAPSRDGRHCDDHPEVELVQRVDDAEPTVRKRLEVYAAQTAPLVEHYRRRGGLVEVPGVGEMDKVYMALKRALNGGFRKG